MQTLTQTLLIFHILCGTVSLATGILAIAFRKKIKIHKPIGFTFYLAMTGVFVTSVYLAIVKNNMFLFLVGFFTYHSALIGFRALKYKQLHLGQKVNMFDWVVEILAGSTNLGLITFATYYYFRHKDSSALIPLTFGLIGARGVYKNIKNFYSKKVQKSFWLQKHIGNMCGSYIGTITAFIVNMNKYWDLPELVVWLGPTLVIAPAIFIEVAKLKKVEKNKAPLESI